MSLDKKQEEAYRSLFRIFYHADKLESEIMCLNPMENVVDRQLMTQLVSLKVKCKGIVKYMDKFSKGEAVEYGEYFDKLNEIIDREFEIKIEY